MSFAYSIIQPLFKCAMYRNEPYIVQFPNHVYVLWYCFESCMHFIFRAPDSIIRLILKPRTLIYINNFPNTYMSQLDELINSQQNARSTSRISIYFTIFSVSMCYNERLFGMFSKIFAYFRCFKDVEMALQIFIETGRSTKQGLEIWMTSSGLVNYLNTFHTRRRISAYLQQASFENTVETIRINSRMIILSHLQRVYIVSRRDNCLL